MVCMYPKYNAKFMWARMKTRKCLHNFNIFNTNFYHYLKILTSSKVKSENFNIFQETSTELNELENSVKNKQELVEKLKDEILSMTVRKELLSKAMEQITATHQVKKNLTRIKLASIIN